MKKIKELVVFTAIVCAMVAAGFMMTGDLKHIEDTNGSDDYTLTTITDENIINRDIGALTPYVIDRNSVFKQLTGISTGVRIYSDKFTGVAEILSAGYVLPSDFVLDLASFQIYEGNLKMAVVLDQEIVAEIEPGTLLEYRLDDVVGTVSLRIAGESASYEILMSESDYDYFNHP